MSDSVDLDVLAIRSGSGGFFRRDRLDDLVGTTVKEPNRHFDRGAAVVNRLFKDPVENQANVNVVVKTIQSWKSCESASAA